MSTLNISALNKADVLAALYNNSKPLGMGILLTSEDMTTEEAQGLLDDGQTYFGYVKGRVMKVNLKGNELRTEAYDRDNGQGAAARVLDSIGAE